MPWECRTFSATRICSSRLACWGEALTAVGVPGAHGELQAAVVTVTGRGRPVAAGFAGCDSIPVHTVRIGGARRQRQRRNNERAREGRQTKPLSGGLQL